ncbi:MAG TPA: pantoate--beta-alanine ligase [Dehalococcoidia bacterium]|nr:pantoate--beta-alanine ligase [Dehalococcoidia bacterium]
MKMITTVAAMQAARDRMSGSVGLVPTMGYLHEGHLSLVRRARADCDHVVVSIFVNPTQFGPGEDLERYPRDPERDLGLLESVLLPPRPPGGRGAQGVRAAVFMPFVDEVYPPGFDDWVELHGPLADRLEGAARPGHFRGVTTVVARLFRIVRPDRAYFGQKDAQQLRVIRRMVRDLRLPVEIVPLPTVRDADGLALSSRNVYLSPEQRRAALVLPRAVALARRLVMDERLRDAAALRQRLEACVGAEPLVRLEYVSVADEDTLEELATIDRPAVVLLAARVGATRLIDNAVVVPPGVAVPEGLRPLCEEIGAAGEPHSGPSG